MSEVVQVRQSPYAPVSSWRQLTCRWRLACLLAHKEQTMFAKSWRICLDDLIRDVCLYLYAISRPGLEMRA